MSTELGEFYVAFSVDLTLWNVFEHTCSTVVGAGLIMGDIYRFLSKLIQTERTVYREIAQNGCCSMTDHPHKMVSAKMGRAAARQLPQQMSPARQYPSVIACQIHSVYMVHVLMSDGLYLMLIDCVIIWPYHMFARSSSMKRPVHLALRICVQIDCQHVLIH